MTNNCCRYFTVSLVPVAALSLAVLFAGGILTLPILYTELVDDYVYGAVIDAGSSHTTLQIYRWSVPTTFSTTGKVEKRFYCPHNQSNSTSVNSYTLNPSEVSKAFSACLNESYQLYHKDFYVKKDLSFIERTPIYLGATGGMRLIRLENPTLSNEIMGNISLALKNSNISQYKFGGAVILNDSTEAVTGWISANYDHLLNDRVPFRSNGSLDLGGASVQIAFESNDTSEKAYIHNETLFGINYQLYARSLLCYGENQAYSRYLAYLISLSNGAPNVPNPCLFKGATITVNSTDIYTVCVNSTTASNVFGHALSPPMALEADSEYTFQGTGNSNLCRHQIQDVFSKFCSLERNCVNKTFTPPISGNFLGLSGFLYTANFFNSSNQTFSQDTSWFSLQSNISSFCNVSYDEAKRQYGKDEFLNIRCFAGQFVTFLLEEGFGFTTSADESWSVQFVDTVDSRSLSWALGYILDKSNSISRSQFTAVRPFSSVDLVIGMIILSILCVIFVIFFLITFQACRKALSTRSGYQNI